MVPFPPDPKGKVGLNCNLTLSLNVIIIPVNNMSLEHPKEGLIRFLRTDFSAFGDSTNKDLVSQRARSLENIHIGQQVGLLLESTHISEIGQRVIVAKMQQAHAEMLRIPSEITPSELGIDGDGLGIYDPNLAPDLETRFYRASLVRLIQETTIVHEMRGKQIVYVKDSANFFSGVDIFNSWREDFVRKHSKEPLDYEKFDPISLARRGAEISPDSVLGQIIQKAQRLSEQLGDGEISIDPQFSDN